MSRLFRCGGRASIIMAADVRDDVVLGLAAASLSLKSQAAGRKRVGTCSPGRKPRFEKGAERLRPTENPSRTCRHMVHTKTHSGSKNAQGFLPHLGVCASGPPLCYIEAFAVKPWA